VKIIGVEKLSPDLKPMRHSGARRTTRSRIMAVDGWTKIVMIYQIVSDKLAKLAQLK